MNNYSEFLFGTLEIQVKLIWKKNVTVQLQHGQKLNLKFYFHPISIRKSRKNGLDEAGGLGRHSGGH